MNTQQKQILQRDIAMDFAKVLKKNKASNDQVQALAQDLAKISIERIYGVEPLPETAPELYIERAKKSENPIEFMQRVWGKWLEANALYQFQLRKLDAKLLSAISGYCKRHNLNPKDFLPPTKSDYTDHIYQELNLENLHALPALVRRTYKK